MQNHSKIFAAVNLKGIVLKAAKEKEIFTPVCNQLSAVEQVLRLSLYITCSSTKTNL